MTQDPIGLEGGTNKYLYPLNPLTRLDPLGLVDLNLFNTGENISGYADKVPLSDTVYKVGAHGNPTMIVDQAGKKITVDELAKKIRKDPKYKKGMPIELLSCNTGKTKDGYAQKLSDKMKAEVRAPDQYLWYDSQGKTTPMGLKVVDGKYVMDTSQPGKINIFTPRK
ncbi:hypothetical protein LJR117_000001 [Acidovorax sp. LjRoot117]